jgi:type I restriction enzyme, S subunit
VVTGRYGTLGEVFYIEHDFWPLNTTLYVQDFKGNDPQFVSYFLRTLDLANQNVAGAVPGVNRNALHLLPVTCPELRIQRRIADILSAYDDLIENNTRRIALLEEMARAIYREWFVDFRFPGHEQREMVESELGPVPAGWEVKNLLDLAVVTYGYPFKSKQFTSNGVGMPVIRIRDIPNDVSQTYTKESADEKFLVRNGDLLVGMDGEFHRGKWAGGDAYLNQRVARFRTNGLLSPYHLFLALQAPIEYFNATITGTTVAHLGDKHLRQVKLLLPPENIAKKARDLFDPMFALEVNLRVRNWRLRRTRDLLLPRLISGEIDVTAVEEELAGAAA